MNPFGAKNGARFNVKVPYTPYIVPEKSAQTSSISKLFLSATNEGYFEIKKTMMEEKATLNVFEKQYVYTGDRDKGRTLLHCILTNNNLSNENKYELIKMAIEMKAFVDRGDNYNVRPLHLAAAQQNSKLVKLLLGYGADPNSKDNQQMSPLHYALQPTLINCGNKDATLKTQSLNDDFLAKVRKNFDSETDKSLYKQKIQW